MVSNRLRVAWFAWFLVVAALMAYSHRWFEFVIIVLLACLLALSEERVERCARAISDRIGHEFDDLWAIAYDAGVAMRTAFARTPKEPAAEQVKVPVSTKKDAR